MVDVFLFAAVFVHRRPDDRRHPFHRGEAADNFLRDQVGPLGLIIVCGKILERQHRDANRTVTRRGRGCSRSRYGSRGGRGFTAALAQEKASHTKHDHRGGDADPFAGAALGLGWGHVAVAGSRAMSGAWRGLRLAKRLVFRLRLANAEPTNRLVDELVRLGFVQSVERNVLDAGELVLHRLRDVALLEVNRQDDFLAFAGEGEFLDDVLGAGGVAADGEDEDGAGTDGLDDFLGPHGGAVDVGFVHPDGHALRAQVLNHLDDLLLVLPRVADKNVRCHRELILPFLIFLDERCDTLIREYVENK